MVEASYAAGIVDGEGYIGIRRPVNSSTYGVIVKVTMTDKGTLCLERLRQTFGGRLAHYMPAGARRRPVAEWALSGQPAAAFLRRIRPYLLVKGESADIALELQAMIDAAPRRGTRPHATWTTDMSRRAAVLKQRIQYANRVGLADGEVHLPLPCPRMGRAAGWQTVA